MFFSIITKNLNWGILTKNLVTFKRWDWVRMKNFNILEVNRKIWFLQGVHKKKQYTGGNCLKRKAWTVCRFKRRLYKKEGVVFLRGGHPNAHYLEYGKGMVCSAILRPFGRPVCWFGHPNPGTQKTLFKLSFCCKNMLK